jgi:CRISPR system Cascade subunit CasB
MNYDHLSFEEQKALIQWHRWLNDNRGDRARLRRAERPEDILLTDALFHFLKKMPEIWAEQKLVFTSASIAGILSHVQEDSQTPSELYRTNKKNQQKKMASFAEQLAGPSRMKKPPMSELRFQQMQKSRSTSEFYRRILRAIDLLDKRVNIASVANDIIQWHREFENQVERRPSNRLAVRWASDYFTALSKKKGE